VNGIPLFTWEFSTAGNFVKVQSTAANRGDTLEVWYFVAPTITTGSTTTVETSCIFGKDWLEELAVIRACMHPTLRQATLSASQSPADYHSMYRTLGEDYDRIYNAHLMQFQREEQRWENERRERMMNGPNPVRYSGHGAIRNKSIKGNYLTGAGGEGIPG
jgi:hypothetical protein